MNLFLETQEVCKLLNRSYNSVLALYKKDLPYLKMGNSYKVTARNIIDYLVKEQERTLNNNSYNYSADEIKEILNNFKTDVEKQVEIFIKNRKPVQRES